jgi:plastocyanin
MGYPGSAPILITYQDYEIIPASLSIVAGTPIQFVMAGNNSAVHQPYSDSSSNPFEAPAELKSNETFEFTFSEPGTVTLLCKVHLEMRATLTVIQP